MTFTVLTGETIIINTKSQKKQLQDTLSLLPWISFNFKISFSLNAYKLEVMFLSVSVCCGGKALFLRDNRSWILSLMFICLSPVINEGLEVGHLQRYW